MTWTDEHIAAVSIITVLFSLAAVHLFFVWWDGYRAPGALRELARNVGQRLIEWADEPVAPSEIGRALQQHQEAARVRVLWRLQRSSTAMEKRG